MGSGDKGRGNASLRTGFIFGVAIVFVVILICCGFFASGFHVASLVAPPSPGNPSGDRYVAQITDFYRFIVSLQFSVIGIILAVAFLYVHTVSKQQARDMAADALESTSFTSTLTHAQNEMESRLLKSVEEHWADLKNSSETEKIRTTVKELAEHLEWVEQALEVYTSSSPKPTNLNLAEPPAKDGE